MTTFPAHTDRYKPKVAFPYADAEFSLLSYGNSKSLNRIDSKTPSLCRVEASLPDIASKARNTKRACPYGIFMPRIESARSWGSLIWGFLPELLQTREVWLHLETFWDEELSMWRCSKPPQNLLSTSTLLDLMLPCFIRLYLHTRQIRSPYKWLLAFSADWHVFQRDNV